MNKLKQLLIYFTIIFISFNLHAGASDDVKTNSEDFETSEISFLSPTSSATLPFPPDSTTFNSVSDSFPAFAW